MGAPRHVSSGSYMLQILYSEVLRSVRRLKILNKEMIELRGSNAAANLLKVVMMMVLSLVLLFNDDPRLRGTGREGEG